MKGYNCVIIIMEKLISFSCFLSFDEVICLCVFFRGQLLRATRTLSTCLYYGNGAVCFSDTFLIYRISVHLSHVFHLNLFWVSLFILSKNILSPNGLLNWDKWRNIHVVWWFGFARRFPRKHHPYTIWYENSNSMYRSDICCNGVSRNLNTFTKWWNI